MVLSRVASNIIPVRSTRSAGNDQNTPPSKASAAKASVSHVSAITSKISSSMSTLAAASRRRRARLQGGSLEKDRQRVTDSARRRSRTTSRTPPSTPSHRAKRDSSGAALRRAEKHAEAEAEAEMDEDDDCEMGDLPPAHEDETPVFRGVTLPRRLARPAYREVSEETLAAIDPELATVPIEYVRDGLRMTGVDMLTVLASTSTVSTMPSNKPNAALPKQARVRITQPVSDLPSHMLAVYSPEDTKSMGQKRKVTLLPAHSLMLAAHCAGLPALPPSTRTDVTGMSETDDEKQDVYATLPVVGLSVPSAQTFPLLSAYLYTQNEAQLTRALLGVPLAAPPPYSASEPSPSSTPTTPSTKLAPGSMSPTVLASLSADERAKLVATMAAQVKHTASLLTAQYTADPSALLDRAGIVAGLWRNACALGVYEPGLWRALDAAWAVIVTALGAYECD